mgnify:CR=1 FL=1
MSSSTNSMVDSAEVSDMSEAWMLQGVFMLDNVYEDKKIEHVNKKMNPSIQFEQCVIEELYYRVLCNNFISWA